MDDKVIFNEEYIQNFFDFQKVGNVDMLAEYWEYYKQSHPFNLSNNKVGIIKEYLKYFSQNKINVFQLERLTKIILDSDI